MSRLTIIVLAMAALICCARMAAAAPATGTRNQPPQSGTAEPFLLGLPEQPGPLVVEAHFDFYDINEINDGAETFEFTGVITLKWKDPRMAFDPAVDGVDEKIYQGDYQFNELATGWYPQVVLVNEAGNFEMGSVILRVEPDGTSILVQTMDATAEVEFNMSRYPFDKHRLIAVFEVLGYDKSEVLMRVEKGRAGALGRGNPGASMDRHRGARVRPGAPCKLRRTTGGFVDVRRERGCDARALLRNAAGRLPARGHRPSVVYRVLDGPVVARRQD